MTDNFYTYIYLNPLKPGNYNFGEYSFDYEPFYVGKGHGNRIFNHLTEDYNKSVNKFKLNVINKIITGGFDLKDFIIKVHENITNEEACIKEIELIALIGRRNKKSGTLTNLTDGGEGRAGYVVSDDAKLRISKARSNSKASDTTRKKISDARKKQVITDEHKRKISEGNKGKIISDEHKSKISKSLTGIIRSDETKQKISDSQKGRIPWNKGKKNIYSNETKQKISDSQKGRIPWNKGKKLNGKTKNTVL